VQDRVERVEISEGPGPGDIWRAVRYETDDSGSVSVLVEHVRRSNGSESVIDTFRPARWTRDQLVSIEIVDD
jgi:hypothetical protein